MGSGNGLPLESTVWPLFAFLAFFAGIVGITVVSARRRTKGW